jgi:rubredoxin
MTEEERAARGLVTDPQYGCPQCGEERIDFLAWDEDGVIVTCQSCGNEYDPMTPKELEDQQ